MLLPLYVLLPVLTSGTSQPAMVSVITRTSSIKEVAAWILTITPGANASKLFHDNQIDGEALFELTEDDIKEMAVALGPRKKVLKHLTALRSSAAGESIRSSMREPQAATVRDMEQPQAATVRDSEQPQAVTAQAQLTAWLITHTKMKHVHHSFHVLSVDNFVARIRCDLCVSYLQAKSKNEKYVFGSLVTHQLTKDHKRCYKVKYGGAELDDLVKIMNTAPDIASESYVTNLIVAVNSALATQAFQVFMSSTQTSHKAGMQCTHCSQVLYTPIKGSLANNAKEHFRGHRMKTCTTPVASPRLPPKSLSSYFSPSPRLSDAKQSQHTATVLEGYTYCDTPPKRRRISAKRSLNDDWENLNSDDAGQDVGQCVECDGGGSVVQCFVCERSVHASCAVDLSKCQYSCQSCNDTRVTGAESH
jgi:hypothetical protein